MMWECLQSYLLVPAVYIYTFGIFLVSVWNSNMDCS